MYPARDRLYRLLLAYPKQSWTQKELAARARCSRGYVSRVASRLTETGVLGRPFKNRIVLTAPAKLLTVWAGRRALPAPAYVATSFGAEAIERILRDWPGAAVTLFRGAWHRTKFMATSSVETYVMRESLPGLVGDLGAASAEPTTVVLYPTDGDEIEGVEHIDGVPVVSVPQNVVDLMAIGGQGPRVALNLANAAGLWEV